MVERHKCFFSVIQKKGLKIEREYIQGIFHGFLRLLTLAVQCLKNQVENVY